MLTSRRAWALLLLVAAVGLLAAFRARRIAALESEFARRDQRAP